MARGLLRAEQIRDRLRALQDERDRLVQERDDAIRALSRAGLSYEVVAQAAGVSRARVGQIVTSGEDTRRRSA